MNGACLRRLFLHPGFSRLYRGLARTRHRHRKQGCRYLGCLSQFAPLQGATPLEYLVGVHPVGTRYQRHTRTGFQRQLDNPALLRHRPPSANPTFSHRSRCIHHDHIVRLIPTSCQRGRRDAYVVAARPGADVGELKTSPISPSDSRNDGIWE